MLYLRIQSKGELVNECIFSADRRYRYRLDFKLEDGAPFTRVVFVLLNPSTADEERLDPTLRRCRGYAAEWGFRAVTIVNLFAYRSTKPSLLLRVPDPIGPTNDYHILEATRGADAVIFGWGAVRPRLRPRARAVERLVLAERLRGGVMCLGQTTGGEPRHPLYLRRTAKAYEYAPR